MSALRRGWCRGKGHTHGCCGGCRHYILLCIRPEGGQRCKVHKHQSPCVFVVIPKTLYFSSFLATAASCSLRIYAIRHMWKCPPLIRTHHWTLERALSNAMAAIWRHRSMAPGKTPPMACSSYWPAVIVQSSRSAIPALRL